MADKDELMPLRQLGKELPGRPSYGTVRSWIRDGAVSNQGELVKMEHRRLPGGSASSIRLYEEFIDKLND